MKLVIKVDKLSERDIDYYKRETSKYDISIISYEDFTKITAKGTYDDLVYLIHFTSQFGNYQARLM